MPSKPRSEEPKPACDALRSSQDVCVFDTVKKTKLQHPEPDESDSEFGGFKVGRLSARRSRRPLASPTSVDGCGFCGTPPPIQRKQDVERLQG